METIVGLVGFSFVNAVTPGPTNVLLWASGAEFGFRGSVRQVLGTAAGIGAIASIVGAGAGALLTLVPQVAFAMKVGASIYLLYLAWQVAGAQALERGELGHPIGVLQAAAFQAINPKAWIFALGAMSAFRPPELPVLSGSAVVVLTMMAVVVPCAALWAGAGGALSRLLTGPRSRRAVSLALALLLVATIVFVWF